MTGILGKRSTNQTENADKKQRNDRTYCKCKYFCRVTSVLSFVCSTIGMTLDISCFFGITDVFGFQSPDVVLNSAFGILLASVFLGILAIMLSFPICKFVETSPYPMLHRAFGLFHNSRDVSYYRIDHDCNNVVRTTNTHDAEKKSMSSRGSLKANENVQVSSNSHQDILSQFEHSGTGLSAQTSQQSGTSLQWKNDEFDHKVLLPVKRRQMTFLFDHCVTVYGHRDLKSWNCISDIFEKNEISNSVPRMDEAFVSDIDIQKQEFQLKRQYFEEFPQRGINSYKVLNIGSEEYSCEWRNRFRPSTETLQAIQKHQISEVISKLNTLNFKS